MHEGSFYSEEVEDSLQRLEVDVIDLYQIHWPFPDHEIEEDWTVLADLKREGKVRHIGACNFSVEQMRRAESITAITSLQPPYSLAEREIEQEILPYAHSRGIGVIVWSPLKSGLFSGTMSAERVAALPEDDWRKTDRHFTEPWLTYYLELAEVLRIVGQRYGRSPAEVAIAWTLRLPAVTGAIVGARRPAQIEGLLGAGTFRLSPDDICQIESYFRDRVPPDEKLREKPVFSDV